MHDHELQGILDDEEWWLPKGVFSHLDIASTLDGTVDKFDRGELDKDAVKHWALRKGPSVRDDGQPLYHLKLLCIRPDESETSSQSKLPASKDMYEAVRSAWNLPSWTLRFLDNGHGNGAVMPFGRMMPSRTNVKSYGIAVKNANSHRMVTIHDPETRTTSVLLCESLSAEPSATELIDRIEKSKEDGCFPILAPFLLIEALENEINDIQAGHRNRIEAVERKTYFYAFDDEESDDEDDADDLVDYTREYTKIHSLSRSLQMSLDDALQGAELLQKMHQHWLDHLTPQGQNQALGGWHELSERLLLTEKLLRKNSFYIDHDQSGIQLSIQTIYALIGTNDSHLNYETAQSSLRIVEDSRKVAVLTRYDSTDMRVIAGTTLLFLPATFVATLFSTDFFNFKPPGDGLVSKLVWIYFAVSAVLTIAVMVVWRVLSYRREKETSKLLDPPAHKDVEQSEKQDEEEDEEEEAQSVVEGKRPVELIEGRRSSTSGVSTEEIKNRLSKRKKTRTMEMEEAIVENGKSS